ncbi:MAG: XdhC family protein [Anaerolineaceae bacterium]|nr:XdhC family protein [Anaerolineaceae bacterium]
MRELLSDIENWTRQGKKIVLATVIDANHSAPRGIGAKMAISSDGEMSGSVSAGCVEGAVVEEALQVIRSGIPKRLHYGIADEQAWDVGLTCGGNIDVYVELMCSNEALNNFPEILTLSETEQYFVTATIVEGTYAGKKLLFLPGGEIKGSTGNKQTDTDIAQTAYEIWQLHRSALKTVKSGDESLVVFFDAQLPGERVIIIGAAHIAIHLVNLAKQMNFHTIVIDPRAAFATKERFPYVDELYKQWPQETIPGLRPDASTYLVILSHDAKIDIPALDMGLKLPFRYIGLLGSRATQSDRRAGLTELGYNDKEMERIHGPIGVPIGSRLPDEIALSIMAEIVAVKRGKA